MANNVEIFWKAVREIKLDDIRKAAAVTLKVGVVGVADEVDWLEAHFRGGSDNASDLRRLADSIRRFETGTETPPIDKLNECTVISASPGAAAAISTGGTPLKVPIYTIGNEGEWQHFRREILDSRWDLHLALGRNLPGMRAAVVEYTVVNAACINAEIAVVSGVAASIPGLPTYPLVPFGDWLLLTKNQVMLAFRLAGACGLPIDLVHLKSEVLSVIFAGFGWRGAARVAVGMIPVAGIPLKGVVAYAGTYAMGRAIAHFFVTGSPMGRSEELREFREAMQKGREFVRERFRRGEPATTKARGDRPNQPFRRAGRQEKNRAAGAG